MSTPRVPATRSATVKPEPRWRVFLRRQFGAEETLPQRRFDLLTLTVALPGWLVLTRLLHTSYDATVPSGWPFLILLSVVLAVACFVSRTNVGRLPWIALLLCVPLFAGAAVISLLGTLIVLGVYSTDAVLVLAGLGAPVVAFASLRLGARSLRHAAEGVPSAIRMPFVGVGGFTFPVLLMAALWVAGLVSGEHQERLIHEASGRDRSKAVVILLWVFPGVDLHEIHRAAEDADWDEPEFDRLDELHLELIGEGLPLWFWE